MATNPYFNHQYNAITQDQVIFNDLIVESIQVKGQDHYYLPRTLKNFDEFFGEDQSSAFNSATPIEMYLKNVEGYGGQGSFLEKFGLEIRDSAVLVVSISRFTEEITSVYPTIKRPMEGDIIAFPSPIDNRIRFFEISFVNNESVFYQVGKLYTYEITVKNFEYSGETFQTGIEELDSYETIHSISTDIIVAAGGVDYSIGERVSQLGGFSGEVISFTDNTLVLIKVSGELDETLPLLGGTSGASRNIITLETEVGQDSSLNDNDYVQEKVTDGLINFSESNPFSGN